MPALDLDAAFVHVNRADTNGNGQILGPDPFFDELLSRRGDAPLRHDREGRRPRRAPRRGPAADRDHQPTADRRRGRGPAGGPLHLVSPGLRPRRGASSGRTRRRVPTPTRGRPSSSGISRSTRPATRPRSARHRRVGVGGSGWPTATRERHDRGDAAPRCAPSPARRPGAATVRSWPAPSGPSPAIGAPAGAAHLRARPRAHRRRGGAHGQHAALSARRARARSRGVDALPAGLRRGVVRSPPRDDDGHPGRPLRQPEHQLHRRLGPAQGPADRGARCAGQHHQPHDELLGPRPFAAQLRRATSTWSGASDTTGRRRRGRRQALPRDPAGRLQPGGLRLRDAGPRHAAALGPPRRGRRARSSTPPASTWSSPTTSPPPASPTPEELELIRRSSTRAGSATRNCPRDRAAHDGPHMTGPHECEVAAGTEATPPALPDPHPALRTRLCELVGVRYPIVQTGMGWVAGPRLVAATAEAGGLGILASATMTLEELRAAIAEVRSRTDAPFGVNLRTDAADVEERVALLVGSGVKVASFAQAPRPDLVDPTGATRGSSSSPPSAPGATPRRWPSGGSTVSSPRGPREAATPGRCPPRCSSPRSSRRWGTRWRSSPPVASSTGRGLVAALAYGADGHRHGDALPAHPGEHGARGGEDGLPGHAGHGHGGDDTRSTARRSG